MDTIAELKSRDIEPEEAGYGAGWSPIRSAIVILIENDYLYLVLTSLKSLLEEFWSLTSVRNSGLKV